MFYFDDDEYLIVADCYSKYPFVCKLPRGQSNSKAVANLAKQVLSEHGVHVVVRYDMGHIFRDIIVNCQTNMDFNM